MDALVRLLRRDDVAGKVAANTAWLFADRLIRMAIGLVVNVWVARYLGPAHFGTLNYAVAFVALFASFAALGLDTIIVRDLVKEPDAAEEILGTSFFLRLGAAALVFPVIVGSLLYLRPGDTAVAWMVVILAGGLVFQSFDVIDFWFQSRIRSKYTVYARNAAFLAVSALKVSFILAKAPITWFAATFLAEIAFGAVGLVIAYRRSGRSVRSWKVQAPLARRLLRDSWPLILTGFAIYVQARIDQVMIGQMVGDAEVGQYSAAMRLIETFGFIPVVIQTSIAPAVTEAKVAGEEVYHRRLLFVYRMMAALFIVTAVPIFLFAEKIVVLCYGPEYREAGILLSLFAIRLFFTNFGVAKSLYITNENFFRYSLVTAIVGSVANVVLNYALIPRYSSAGAIWAMIISFFITTFVIDLIYPEARKNLRIMVHGMLTPWKLGVR